MYLLEKVTLLEKNKSKNFKTFWYALKVEINQVCGMVLYYYNYFNTTICRVPNQIFQLLTIEIFHTPNSRGMMDPQNQFSRPAFPSKTSN